MNVAIIIVTYNGRKLLENCLHSLFQQTYSDYGVILVDNGSSDGTVSFVKTNYPKVNIIEISRNLGFAKANNQGMHEALKHPETKYIALLNNDVVLTPSWLKILIRSMEGADSKVGGGVGKILSLANPHILDSTGDFVEKRSYMFKGRGHGFRDSGQYNKSEEVFSVTAAACLFRREMVDALINQTGECFDEEFFAYLEDVDLCIRARWLGWKFFYFPRAVVYHLGAATSDRSTGLRIFYSFRNINWLALKNYPTGHLVKMLIRYHYHIALHMGYSLLKGRIKVLKSLIRTYPASLAKVPVMIAKRKMVNGAKVINTDDFLKWFHSQSLS